LRSISASAASVFALDPLDGVEDFPVCGFDIFFREALSAGASVIGFAFLCFVFFHALGDLRRTHQEAQGPRAAIENVVVIFGQHRTRPAHDEFLDALRKRVPAIVIGRIFLRAGCSRFGYVDLVFHHGAEDKAAPEVVDNYSPTLGNIEEFNRFEVFFALLGWAFRD
jgi:hypothetical protein